MIIKQATYKGKTVFIHYTESQGEFILVSYSPEKTKLFKLSIKDLEEYKVVDKVEKKK